MKFVIRTALLASIWAFATNSLISCSSPDAKLVYDDGTPVSTDGTDTTGSLKLALAAGGQTVNSVTAIISGKHGFVTQTHNIDVSDGNGVISIFFGGLPIGSGYSIQLTAGQCSGTSKFAIQADQTTLVNVTLTCPGSDNSDDHHQPQGNGSVQVTGTIQGAGSSNGDCDLITKIVAAPSVQDGDGPTSTIELVLKSGVTPTAIAWTVASTTGATGTITNQSGTADNQINFDCTANGTAYVIGNVTAASGAGTCTEQTRAAITCTNQTGSGSPGTTCGNNIIEGTEQCDGTTIPASAPAGSHCSASCTLVRCGDGIINQGTEQCDGAAIPAGQAAGTTCSSLCILVPPVAGATCGNNVIDGTEQCDGTTIPASAPAGSSCSATCTLVRCGDNAINRPQEQCDGTAIPATAPAGSTCSNLCILIPPATVRCGDGIINGTDQCDGSALPASAPVGSTCSATCTVVPPVATVRCGDSIINGTDQCDGAALPASAPVGSTCSATCTLVPPTTGTQGTCGTCALGSPDVTLKRAAVNAQIAATKPVLDCFLGVGWEAGNKTAATACAAGDLLSCYCGQTPADACSNAAPASLNGPCIQQVLTATGCTTSSCVSSSFLATSNANGVAAQYAQGLQNFCYDSCFPQ